MRNRRKNKMLVLTNSVFRAPECTFGKRRRARVVFFFFFRQRLRPAVVLGPGRIIHETEKSKKFKGCMYKGFSESNLT